MSLSPLVADTAGGGLSAGRLFIEGGPTLPDPPSFRIEPIQIGSYGATDSGTTVTVPIMQPYKIIGDSNGNGLLDPGESAALQFTVSNRWDDASNVLQNFSNSAPGAPINPAIATTQVTASFALPTNDPVIGPVVFNPDDPSSYDEKASIIVYDSLGVEHELSSYFAQTPNPGTWTLFSVIDGDTAQMTATTVVFDAGGALSVPVGGIVDLNSFISIDGAAPLNMALDLGGTLEHNAPFAAIQLSQNGSTNGQVGPIATVNTLTQTLGDVPSQGSVTLTYDVSVPATVTGHQYLTFTAYTFDLCPLPQGCSTNFADVRSFTMELGTLSNNVPAIQTIGTNPQDHFHTWHFTLDGPLPSGQDTLTFQTQASNDIDILVGYQTPVQYSIDLMNQSAPGLTPAEGLYYYNVPDAQTGASPGGNEYVNIPHPQPGNYFVTVVNDDRTANAQYTLTAFTNRGGVGTAASSTIAYQQESGSSGSGGLGPSTLFALSGLALLGRRRAAARLVKH